MKKIRKQIKALFGTDKAFCLKFKYRVSDFPSKRKSIQNQINKLDLFMEPLGLKIKIVKVKNSET